MSVGLFNPQVPTDNDIGLGEGIVYFDLDEVTEAVIGACRGGNKIEIDKIIREMPFDGAYGPHKSLRRYERYVPRLIVNLLKISYLSLAYAMPVTVTDMGDYHQIDFRLNIEDTDYSNNVAFVGQKLDGKAIIAYFYNALNDGNISFEFKEKDEVTSEMQYTAHYASNALTTVPFEFRDYDV